jgi:hypothetical protein
MIKAQKLFQDFHARLWVTRRAPISQERPLASEEQPTMDPETITPEKLSNSTGNAPASPWILKSGSAESP